MTALLVGSRRPETPRVRRVRFPPQTSGAYAFVGGAVLTTTGVGAEIGVPLGIFGATTYSFGTGLSEVGNLVRFLGGQSGERTGAEALSIITMRLNPAAQILGEQTLSRIVDSVVPNPCG